MSATDTPLSSDSAMSSTLPICVVVPCFNEAEGIHHLAESLARFDEAMGLRYDVAYVMVDDGSTDETHARLIATFGEDPRCTVLSHSRNLGAAAAILTGLRYSEHEIVCSIDSDCTYEPRQLLELLPELKPGVDIVTASPYHPEGSVLGVPGWRLMLSRVASMLYRIVLKTNLYCYTSCFRVYRRSAVAPLTIANPGFVGIAELLWRAEVAGRTVIEAPAVLRTRKFGHSKMKVVRTTMVHFRLLAQIALGRVFPSLARRDWENKRLQGAADTVADSA